MLTDEWKDVLLELFELCVEISELVCVVLNHSSPEGYLPMKINDTDVRNNYREYNTKLSVNVINIVFKCKC